LPDANDGKRAMLSELILIGRFGAPHGVGGEIRLSSFTGDPCAIASYTPLVDESGKREFSIVHLRLLNNNLLIAAIGGVCNRAGAAALTNTALYVPRAALPKTAAEEFYLADLIGLEAVTKTGEHFGRVLNVLNYGGGDILEVARAGLRDSLLLPFTKGIFPSVDLEARRLTVLPPTEIEAKPAYANRQRCGARPS
jgi:16S rRNA processing protein RimM